MGSCNSQSLVRFEWKTWTNQSTIEQNLITMYGILEDRIIIYINDVDIEGDYVALVISQGRIRIDYEWRKPIAMSYPYPT